MPPKVTAGLARSRVRGYSRSPAPPASRQTRVFLTMRASLLSPGMGAPALPRQDSAASRFSHCALQETGLYQRSLFSSKNEFGWISTLGIYPALTEKVSLNPLS